MSDKEIAMSPQQRKFAESSNPLKAYKNLVVGKDASWFHFLGYEFYTTFFSNIPGLLGFGTRSLLAPRLIASGGKGLALGRGVNIRTPKKLSLGKGVIIDDYACLDIRNSSEKASGISIGDHVFLGRYTNIVARDAEIKLGAACNISSHCRIGSISGIEIGESALIAAYVYIGCGNHNSDDPDKPIMEQGMEDKGGVKIGRNVWIGTRATILDGVTIGDNAIIGAHSLVREDVPDNAIVAGTPAKVIRTR